MPSVEGHLSLYCELEEGAGAHKHGLRCPCVKPMLRHSRLLDEVTQEMPPGAHLTSSNRVSVTSHHIQPRRDSKGRGYRAETKDTTHREA